LQDLYERYYRRVRAYFAALGLEQDRAQDLTQDLFLHLYENMENMEEMRAEAGWPYLATVAKRTLLNFLRSQNARKRAGRVVDLDSYGDSIQSVDDPAGELLERERSQRLRSAIDNLAPGMRGVLLLWLEGSSYEEIATAIQVSPDAVKSRLRDARRALSAQLAVPGDSDDDTAVTVDPVGRASALLGSDSESDRDRLYGFGVKETARLKAKAQREPKSDQ